MASLLRNFIHHESSDRPAPLSYPEPVVSRDTVTWDRGSPKGGTCIELTEQPQPQQQPQQQQQDAGPSRASTDRDLEMSRPPTPEAEPEDAAEPLPTMWSPYMNRFRLLAACLSNLTNGLSDGAAGALIPYMEEYYKIEYGVVSLIFVGQALGFVCAAVAIDPLRQRFGRARALGMGQLAMVLGYVPAVCGAPWVVVVLSFFLVGFGIATNVAMGNTFCTSLRNSTVTMGLMHGSYGVGGTVGPLAATAFVTVLGALWSRYYLVTVGLGALTLSVSVWSFWRYERDLTPRARAAETTTSEQGVLVGMLGVLRLRVVLLASIFIFAYQGAEVAISGWITSFLIHARGGDPSEVGYVSAGFWAGITVGRFVLSAPAQKVGERRMVYGLTTLAAVFQVLVWTVPHIVTDAVAVSIVGLVLGPIYPCAATVFMRGINRRDALSGMSAISACGSLGGALAPFITGLLAQAVGTFVLHPIAVFLFCVMLLCWWAMRGEDKREE